MSLLSSAELSFEKFVLKIPFSHTSMVSNSMAPDNAWHILALSGFRMFTKFISERALEGKYSM